MQPSELRALKMSEIGDLELASEDDDEVDAATEESEADKAPVIRLVRLIILVSSE